MPQQHVQSLTPPLTLILYLSQGTGDLSAIRKLRSRAARPPASSTCPVKLPAIQTPIPVDGIIRNHLQSLAKVRALQRLRWLAVHTSTDQRTPLQVSLQSWVTAEARFEVACACMVNAKDAYLAKPRPPQDSPPATPPPEPLPTSTLLWNVVGRPVMADGFSLSRTKLQELQASLAQVAV